MIPKYIKALILGTLMGTLGLQAATTIPAEFAYPLSSASAANRGFSVTMKQATTGAGGLPNSNARTEAQLAGTLINPNTLQPHTNTINFAAAAFNVDGTFTETTTINYEQTGSTGQSFPGIPGLEGGNDNIAMEVVSWLELQPGTYSMIVNSDDGFRVSVGKDARDKVTALVLCEYDGGRGAADSIFDFTVTQAGLYSFRLIYEEGGGGANCSWFTAPVGGTDNRVLVNADGGVKAYSKITAATPAYLSLLAPANGDTGVSPGVVVTAVIKNGSAGSVASSSVKLTYDGAIVAATISQTNGATKVTFDPPGLLEAGSKHTVILEYADGSAPKKLEYSFTSAAIGNITLPTPIWLETFETTSEGAVPAGWTFQNFTSGANGSVDYDNPNSDAYLNWVVISKTRVQTAHWDVVRRLNITEQFVNGEAVKSLINGNFLYAESDNRGGSQVQYAFSPDINLTGKTNIYLSFHNIYEQNQDSIGAVEYSIDKGITWLPILYMLDGADIVRDAAGNVDGYATMVALNGDTASYQDPVTGEICGNSYGAFIGVATKEWRNIGSFISARINDNPVESKRVELFRLTNADNQANVRLRFAQAGTASWYFGIDEVGFYSIDSNVTPGVPTPSPILRVPQDYSSIQKAVDAAKDEDTIILVRGVYKESVDFKGKRLTLRSDYLGEVPSSEDVTQTVIQGSSVGTVVTLGAGARLAGVTVQSGSVGVGVSGGQVVSCIIQDNYAPGDSHGGGVVASSGASIVDCTIRRNTARHGSGVATVGTVSVIGCNLYDNKTFEGAGQILCWGSGEPTFSKCHISHPISSKAIEIRDYTQARFTECLIETFGGGAFISVWNWAGATVVNSTCINKSRSFNSVVEIFLAGLRGSEFVKFQNAILHNTKINSEDWVEISSTLVFPEALNRQAVLGKKAVSLGDPLFVSPSTGDYRLRDDSPAINAGDNSVITDAKATDLDGKKRILGGRVDLGAYERWSFYTERSLTAAEGTPVTAKAVAEDIAAMGGVKFQVESGPEGLSVDATSGQLFWTPTEAQGPGTYTAVVRGTAVNNPSATDTQTLTLTATEVNRAPEFASANVQTTTERLAWAYTAAATDPDLPANKLTYRLVSGPAGATIAADSGLLTWTPGEAEGGASYEFVVEATDNGTPALSAQTTVRLDVQKVNHPPTLASLSNQAIPENQPWTAQAVGQDLDLPAQSVTYSVQSGPSGLTVDSSTGVIQWTPSEAEGPGKYPVTVRVQDPEGLSAEQTFELSVTEVNAAPGLAALPHQMLTYGQTLSLQWAGSDADLPANALSFRLVSGPTNAVVSSAGQLTWTPSRAQAPSTNVLVVAVSDGSLSATNTVRVEVLDFITLVNGTETTNALALLPPAKVSFRLGLPDWVILYSLDGTPPTDTSLFYLEPFSLTESVTVWPIAFSPDFSQSVVGVPIPVTLLRSQTLSVNGGEGLVHQGPGVGLTVVSDSGLPVALSVVSGPARLDNGQLIPTGGGVVRLKATQAGNAEWAPVTLEFERLVAKAAQTIAWTAAPDATFRSAPLQLKASASSGLPLVYSVVDGPGTIVGDRLTLTGAGQVVVRATQAGTADFEAAAADQTVVVKKASQTLTFSTVAGRALSAAPIALVGAASSGLPVVYEVLSGPAQVLGDQLTLTGVGLVVLRASQPGNANYEAAIPKDQQFTVTQGQQTLTFATVGAKTFGDGPVTLSATSSAQLPVTYRVLSGPGTISGDQLTLLGAGAIAVQAIQAGNDQFQAASTSQTITVAKAAQTLTFAALTNTTFSTNAVTLEAKPTSGLPVGYRLISGAGTIAGSKLTLSGIGTFTVAADQGGNTNWLAATSVTNSFVVTRGVQTITFAPIGEQVLSAGSVTLSAVSSAGLAVNFSVMSGPATVSGTKLTLLNEGTVTVRAINPGSTLWLAGQAEQSFVVRKLTTLAVTVAGNQGGTVAVTPLKDVYAPTDSVTLTATASSGFAFAAWSGDLTGSANPATLAMSANRVVTASFKDIQAPALTWDLPAAGTTGVEQVRLSGQITDNVGVTIAQWSREGGAGQALTLQANGSFSVDNLTLTVGTNRFAIVARDAAGNESKLEREVLWVPQRILTVGDAAAVQEGQRLVFPLSLNTDSATVAGLTFKLTFDPAWVADPQVEWSAAVGQSVNNINLGTAGELTGSFALAGVGLPSGSNRIATVSFRARSVPVATNVTVRPSIVSLGSVTGVSLNQGNAVVSGAGRITTRRIKGDNNANQRLDVGDAVLISRYEVGLEEKRSWDIGLNDLNQSGSLDNGDIIKALRTVVGLDPQPSPGSEVKRLARALGLAKVLVNTNDAMAIELLDGPKATVGQPYRVAVKLNRVKGSLSGLSFALKYPVSLTLTDKQVGALVPGDALPFWNESAGQISLAAIRSTAWANATGVAAVLTFVPSAGFSAQAEWPLKLEQVEITGSGFDVRPVDPVAVAIQSAGGSVNTPPQIALQPPAADGSLTLEIRAPAGATVAIEATGDLNTWIESQSITGQGDSTPVKVTLKPDPTVQAKFWRVRVR